MSLSPNPSLTLTLSFCHSFSLSLYFCFCAIIRLKQFTPLCIMNDEAIVPFLHVFSTFKSFIHTPTFSPFTLFPRVLYHTTNASKICAIRVIMFPILILHAHIAVRNVKFSNFSCTCFFFCLERVLLCRVGN